MIPDFSPDKVWPENEEQPYQVLPDGVYSVKEHDLIWKRFETPFSNSTTRPAISHGYRMLLRLATDRGICLTQWIAGSFTTTKLNPDDVDLCSFASHDHLNGLDTSTQMWLSKSLAAGAKSKVAYKAHTFLVVYYPPGHAKRALYEEARNYWRKQFGFTRDLRDSSGNRVSSGAPKGILSIEVKKEDDMECPLIEHRL